MTDAKLTAGQARVLATLDLAVATTARQVAKRAWPNSPGWDRRSRRHSTPAGGAMAVGLPMLAGVVLGRLQRRGLVEGYHHMGSYTEWRMTMAGYEALANHRQRAAK